MFSREKTINMKYSRAALALEVLSWLLVVGILVYVLQIYAGLGEAVAAAFGESGEVLEYRPKQVVLMQPIAAVFAYIVLTGIGIVFRRAVVPGEEYPILERVLLAVLGVKCVYLIYKLGKCFFVLNELPTPLWLYVALAAALAAVIVFALLSCLRCARTRREGEA